MPSFLILFACFFLSGATGLVYQVVWLRLLSLVFGHTVYAVTTVLAAFMAGLALGSFLFARRSGRLQNPIRVYGWLEVAIGVYCALIPTLFGLAASVYPTLYRSLGLSYQAFSLVQFAIVAALLLLPTSLMGGTLPVLSQALARRDVRFGRIVGNLYAVNTFGAVAGVALAGYALLPALGNRRTITLAALANLAVGLLAIVYSRGLRRAEPEPSAIQHAVGPSLDAPPDHARDMPGKAVWLTVAALGLSGAVSMLYEVAWTRALALVIGSSTYAFTSMLVAVLLGIAAGSALYSWLWGTRRATPATFAVIQGGIGLGVMATMLVFERMPELFLTALRWSGHPRFVQAVQVGVSVASLLPSTLLIGATFPCAVAVAARSGASVGRDVGHVYAVNTLGAIVGAVLGGFLLMPTLGPQATLKMGIVVNLLIAAALFSTLLGGSRVWHRLGTGAALLAAASVALLPPWDQRVMSSGPGVYAPRYLRTSGETPLRDLLRAQANQVVFYRDGLHATVSVHQDGRYTYLRVNGKTDASTSSDMATQLMLGHLPLLLHPRPRTVLVIGLGSGVTAGAVVRHPIERLDVVEIEPAVIEASRFFAGVHGDVLRNPKVRTIVADGRNFLLTSAERHDVIVSEPSNPWISGLASLFSTEFFQLARSRLEPGGIMVQWVQGYSLYPDDLRMVVGTFRRIFPHTSVWNTTRGDFLLVGRLQPAPLDFRQLRARYDAVLGAGDGLRGIGVEGWAGVLGFFVLNDQDAARLADGSRVNTDDRLPLEFSAPRALYVDTADRNWALVRSFKRAPLPDLVPGTSPELDQARIRYWIGKASLGRRAWEDALEQLDRALELDPDFRPATAAASAAHLGLGRPAVALDLARKVLAREPSSADALFAAGLASGTLGFVPQAVDFLERAFVLEPQRGDIESALSLARQHLSLPAGSKRSGAAAPPGLSAPAASGRPPAAMH